MPEMRHHGKTQTQHFPDHQYECRLFRYPVWLGPAKANMGPIYEHLHANADEIPLLFLAAPLTGLIVQPIIGYMSDRTWHPTFRKAPSVFPYRGHPEYHRPGIYAAQQRFGMAAGLLWVLDVFGNVAMEPFRAFVADKLNEDQRTQGFVMQSLMIGLGGSIASALPLMMTNWFHLSTTAESGSFQITSNGVFI